MNYLCMRTTRSCDLSQPYTYPYTSTTFLPTSEDVTYVICALAIKAKHSDHALRNYVLKFN